MCVPSLFLAKGHGEPMKAFLILEDGHVFTGTAIGADKEIISEIVATTVPPFFTYSFNHAPASLDTA